MSESLNPLLADLHRLTSRLLDIVPAAETIDWQVSTAAQWRAHGLGHAFRSAELSTSATLDDLHGIDTQKQKLVANTRQFIAGLPANNVLLWGARGTGKSSLIHALANRYGDEGLRLVEVSRTDLEGIAELGGVLASLPYRFIVFCDDLSFEADDAGYKALKSALEGSLFRNAGNVLIYATSNRRHLLPEYMSDNRDARHVEGELHESEAVEEKVSLSDRFGLWLSFYPFRQPAYLDMARHWARRLAADHGLTLDGPAALDDNFDRKAAAWALARGGRSGRTAQHFARDWVGRHLLQG